MKVVLNVTPVMFLQPQPQWWQDGQLLDKLLGALLEQEHEPTPQLPKFRLATWALVPLPKAIFDAIIARRHHSSHDSCLVNVLRLACCSDVTLPSRNVASGLIV